MASDIGYTHLLENFNSGVAKEFHNGKEIRFWYGFHVERRAAHKNDDVMSKPFLNCEVF